MQKRFSGSIALTKLKCFVTKMNSKKTGNPVEVIIIPIDENYLVRGKEGALYLPVSAIIKDEEDQFGQHGFISQNVDTKVWKDASEEQRETFRKLPILGNLKDFSGYTNDTEGVMHDKLEPTDIGGDDLPF